MKCSLAVGMMMVVVAIGLGGIARGEDAPAMADAAKSLEQIAADVKTILVQERIHDAFDLYRKLKDFGVTYQPTLTAPNDLVSQLDDEQLRLYAGVKLFDAIYAVTFMKRQEVADCVAVIEQIQDKLELRSYADINNYFLHTLKKAAAQPDEVDIPKLIEQLSSDYVNELPDLLGSVESADYLIDSLYGFYIEMNYVFGALMATSAKAQIEEGFNEIKTVDVYKLPLDVFAAFDRMNEEIRVSGETQEKLAVLRKMYDLDVVEESGTLSDADANPAWLEQSLIIIAIRNAILTPAAE